MSDPLTEAFNRRIIKMRQDTDAPLGPDLGLSVLNPNGPYQPVTLGAFVALYRICREEEQRIDRESRGKEDKP